ncbi:hypothetical protein [Nocardia sp. NPDC005366]|uniref:hypothetical protein n=1 Tax=Nocardia sp. NPDC005366 TaxID=3156878 RepID=UPI0033B00C26
MSGLPSKYVRQDWFGPESFVAAVAGMACISLPYIGAVPRDAAWLIAAPPIAGALLIALSAVGPPISDSLRRTGVGMVVAFAGFLLAIPGLLVGLALGATFT